MAGRLPGWGELAREVSLLEAVIGDLRLHANA